MLKFMRKHARFFYVFFFIIIISFIFFYVGPVDKSSDVPVAEIDKVKISMDDYYRAYDRTREAYRENYKEQFNEEMEKKLKLKEKVLEDMIDEKVLLIASGKMGITVTDEEVREAITNDPAFAKNNTFNSDIYFRVLELNRITPEYFEKMKKQELTLVKMDRLISETVDISDDFKQITGDEKTLAAIKQALLFDKRKKFIKSYVNVIKKDMNIKVNSKLIS